MCQITAFQYGQVYSKSKELMTITVSLACYLEIVGFEISWEDRENSRTSVKLGPTVNVQSKLRGVAREKIHINKPGSLRGVIFGGHLVQPPRSLFDLLSNDGCISYDGMDSGD